MYNFIHGKLVKDGRLPFIIQPNGDNFVHLVIEQSPYPGEENSHSWAADHLQPPGSLASPGSGSGRERCAGASASAAAAPSCAGHGSVQGTRGRPKRPGARGPTTVLLQLLSGGCGLNEVFYIKLAALFDYTLVQVSWATQSLAFSRIFIWEISNIQKWREKNSMIKYL
jgi:hypothetical protein